ncbi:MAG: aspartate aminotransferase family protein [Aigarchaeota archaeon]|nr:aspartate aminotransferase family protein [Aigarchaeota archaeon]MCX8192970.1 aspartate aminotransferase family protein [Nitrososphaeria archaeon]MDW7986294.1 aspartate aminotransferase family protein [Nitrososphaerota archaeon]
MFRVKELDSMYLINCIPKRDDLVIRKASGIWVEDDSGRKYIDFFSGIAVNNVGHLHPKVVKAVKEQLDRYAHISMLYYSDVVVELAAKLAEVSPSRVKKSFFCNSGAEAVEGAIKFAKKYAVHKGRSGSITISLWGSFHGRTALALSITGQKKYKARLGNFASYPGVVHVIPPYYYRFGRGMSEKDFGVWAADHIADIIDHYEAGDVATVIVEPILGEGGIIVPPDTYLPRLRKITEERNIPLIVDEVQTGLGRTGKFFACEHWGVEPDIMTLAKALGGGLPIGAIMVSDEISQAMEPGDHFSTFGGNPISCSAAIAVLEIIREEKLVENSLLVGDYLLNGLKEIEEEQEKIGEVRGKGLMIGIEFVEDKYSKKPNVKIAQQVKDEMLKNGYILGVGGIYKNVLRIQPPLTINKEDAERFIQTLSKVIKSIRD